MFANSVKLLLSLATLQSLQSLVSAEFRVTCSPFKRERIDPIATPGKENGHMHTFWGSRAIGPDALTSDDLRASCGTCHIQGDRSAYWMPTLYYVSKNATVPVKVAIFHVYYHGQNADRQPFPEDYSIISGNPDLTEDEARAQGGTGTTWFFEDSDEEKESWELPKKKGGGWLRGNIGFPTSVVKDESLGRYRACTSADEEGCFGVIRMFFAVWYDLRHEWFDFEDGAYLTLSSGGGHTYHGDFIYGWDPKLAKQIVTDTKNYVELREAIGGEEQLVKSVECQKLDEENPFLSNDDWDAMLEANAGNGTVELGVYGRGLTITDGKSMNATFSGKWGDEVGAAAAADDDDDDDKTAPSQASTVVASAIPTLLSESTTPSSKLTSALRNSTTSQSSPGAPLPTALSDAVRSMTVAPGDTTAVVSWVETRKVSPTACAAKRKGQRRRL